MGLAKILAVLALFISSVQTAPSSERILDVPWRRQAHNLSCEAAALRMALEYYAIQVDELTLIGFMTNDRRPPRFDSAGRLQTWGDPATGYVGNPDGRIERYTGYGVYHQPVTRAATTAGATVLASGSGLYGSAVPAMAVYQAVLSGHPVVVWISNTYRQVPLGSYVAYDGAPVRYTLTEHAVTVIGVRSDTLLINDPWFGRAWYRKGQFESAYRTFAGMAVVVGPPG